MTSQEILSLNNIQAYSEGFAIIHQDQKYGAIDLWGKLVIPLQYDYLFACTDGLFAALIGEKWGYIDVHNQTIIPFVYDQAHPFTEGLARVMIDEKYGYIDKGNKTIVSFDYSIADNFSEGLARVYVEDQGFGFINKNALFEINPVYTYALSFKNGLARVESDKEAAGRWGAIDKEGRVIIPFLYSNLTLFKDHYIKGMLAYGQTVYLDNEGQTIKNVDRIFLKEQSQADTSFKIITKGNLYGALDHVTNAEIVAVEYSEIKYLKENRYFLRKSSGDAFLIDQFGKQIVCFKVKEASKSISAGKYSLHYYKSLTEQIDHKIDRYLLVDDLYPDLHANTEIILRKYQYLSEDRGRITTETYDTIVEQLEEQSELNKKDFLAECKYYLETGKRTDTMQKRKNDIQNIRWTFYENDYFSIFRSPTFWYISISLAILAILYLIS